MENEVIEERALTDDEIEIDFVTYVTRQFQSVTTKRNILLFIVLSVFIACSLWPISTESIYFQDHSRNISNAWTSHDNDAIIPLLSKLDSLEKDIQHWHEQFHSGIKKHSVAAAEQYAKFDELKLSTEELIANFIQINIANMEILSENISNHTEQFDDNAARCNSVSGLLSADDKLRLDRLAANLSQVHGAVNDNKHSRVGLHAVRVLSSGLLKATQAFDSRARLMAALVSQVNDSAASALGVARTTASSLERFHGGHGACPIQPGLEPAITTATKMNNTHISDTVARIMQEMSSSRLAACSPTMDATQATFVVPLSPAPLVPSMDYALLAAGSTVVTERTSPTFVNRSVKAWSVGYFSQVALPLVQNTLDSLGVHVGESKPEDALTPSLSLGACWAMQGAEGNLTVRLKEKVIISAVSIDHITSALAISETSAPKDFEVYGQANDNSLERLLLRGTYDLDGGHNVQTFRLSDSVHSYQTVTLRVLSNYGNADYTCLYRFRVHDSL